MGKKNLARCPRCGEKPMSNIAPNGRYIFRHCGIQVAHNNYLEARAVWNWLAEKVRKGRMFEWMERAVRSKVKWGFGPLRQFLSEAREWWNSRRVKR